jgi:hypothetical protein
MDVLRRELARGSNEIETIPEVRINVNADSVYIGGNVVGRSLYAYTAALTHRSLAASRIFTSMRKQVDRLPATASTTMIRDTFDTLESKITAVDKKNLDEEAIKSAAQVLAENAPDILDLLASSLVGSVPGAAELLLKEIYYIDVAKLFDVISRKIDQLPLSVEREGLTNAVGAIKDEALKIGTGNLADEQIVKLSAQRIANVAPDILETIVLVLSWPAESVAIIIREALESSNNVNISGGQIAGRDMHGNNTTGMSADDVAKLFHSIYKKIDKKPEEDQLDIRNAVDVIKTAANHEAVEGRKPDESVVKMASQFLAMTAPDILKDVADVALATFTSPAVGVATIVRKVLAKLPSK